MAIITAVVLGIVQGLTEFLPISSDGHLVLTSIVLGVKLAPKDALGFDILLHSASLLALVLLTRKTWVALLRGALKKDPHAVRLCLLIAVATVPGVLAGLFLEDLITDVRSMLAAAAGFLATALVLIIGELIAGQRGWGETHLDRMQWRHALSIGVAQAVAILPGVSRSGLTISTGLSLGLTRRSAFDFSFLMAVPIIAGAVAKGALDVMKGDIVLPGPAPAIAGFCAAFVVSAGAFLVFRDWVSRRSLAWFALYLLPLAGILAVQTVDVLRLSDPDYIATLLRSFGGIVLFMIALAEATPPLSFVSPGIVVVMVAGSLSRDLHTWLLFFGCATFGMLLGNLTLYWVGRAYGRSIAHKFHLTEKHLRSAEDMTRRIGAAGVIAGQFFGLVRPAVAFVAGTLGMQRRQFVPCAVAGAALWAGAYLYLGYVLREHIEVVVPIIAIGGAILFGGALLGLGGWTMHTRKKRKFLPV